MLVSNIVKKIMSVIITISILLISTMSFAKSEIDLGTIQINQQEFITEIENVSNVQIKPGSTMQNMEYIYTDNGRVYKVVERANIDLTYVYSQVYIKNSANDYVLEYSTITEVCEDNIRVIKQQNGKTTENIIDLKQLKENSMKNKDIQGIKNYGVDSTNVPPISGWEYHDTIKYSYRIYTYTLVAVTAIVSGVAAAAGNAYIAGLANVVSYIIDDHIPRVWYTQYWYRKWRKWPDLVWELVAERCVTYHYSDSQRSNFIGRTESEHWSKGYDI